MVDFVREVIDTGVQELIVTGVSAIERVSTNMMRISYFVRRKGEQLAVIHLVWDREDWLKQWLQWDLVRGDISSELFELHSAIEGGTRKEIH